MKLTTKTRYSLRILCQLASAYKSPPVKSKELAEKQQIPVPYLEQIMLALKSVGLVSTLRGCNGGFALMKSPEKITVLDVMELFEGKIEFSECNKNNSICSMFHRCPTTRVWTELAKELRGKAEKITLADIIKNSQLNNVQEYVI